jgi:hypothetical protein
MCKAPKYELEATFSSRYKDLVNKIHQQLLKPSNQNLLYDVKRVYPKIIEAMRHDALKYRRALLDGESANQNVVLEMETALKEPFVSLIVKTISQNNIRKSEVTSMIRGTLNG